MVPRGVSCRDPGLGPPPSCRLAAATGASSGRHGPSALCGPYSRPGSSCRLRFRTSVWQRASTCPLPAGLRVQHTSERPSRRFSGGRPLAAWARAGRRVACTVAAAALVAEADASGFGHVDSVCCLHVAQLQRQRMPLRWSMATSPPPIAWRRSRDVVAHAGSFVSL